VGAGAPKVLQSQGTGAVPFWFVPAGAVQDAIQDSGPTIGELAALDPLVGYTTHFNEVYAPGAPAALPGRWRAPEAKIVINPQSRLEDCRRFQFHLTRADLEVASIRLRFW
jgi:hypothetical protein